jgi:DNA-binding transcriptional LysR family regulator
MRLEWIDDLLAVLDSGSLARAAERRFLTQSAFTRRVRLIEDSVGATLFDRSRKPVRLLPGVQVLEPDLRDLAVRLRRLREALKQSASPAGRTLTFACQHAITATVSPGIVRALTANGGPPVRVRSGNRDECLLLLLAGEADFSVMYDISGTRVPALPGSFDVVTLGYDMLIPICAPAQLQAARGPVIPIVSYPSEVFLGQVFERSIAPRLPGNVTTASKAETALTLAMLQFALNEIGIAWLPQSLVTEPLQQGRLVNISDLLPAQAMEIRMIRLSEGQPGRSRAVWDFLIDNLDLPTGLKRLPKELPGPVQSVERAE